MPKELAKSKRIAKSVPGMENFLQGIKDKSFYSYYFANTKLLNIFNNSEAREILSNTNSKIIETPSESTRLAIIDKIFDGRFDSLKSSVFSFKVNKMFTNAMGSFFGGSIVTLIDVLTYLNLSLNYEEPIMMASASLNTSFLKAAYEGEKLFIKCKVEKVGSKLIFMTCDLYNSKYEKIAQGTHVMAWIVQPNQKGLAKKDSSKFLKNTSGALKSIKDRILSENRKINPVSLLGANKVNKQRILNLMTSFNNMNLTHKNKVLRLMMQNQGIFPKEIQYNPNNHKFKFFVRKPLL